MAVIWLALAHYFTGFSGFLAYGFVIFGKFKISSMDIAFLCGFLVLVAIHFGMKDPYVVIRDFRFFWGWIFFYFIFKKRLINIESLQTVLVLLCLYTLLEAVLINTIISPVSLPNSPELAYYGGSSHFIGGGSFQRPFSFGGSPSISSPLLVVLMACCRVRGWRFWLATLTVMTFLSGVGMAALMLLLVVRYRLLMMKTILPLGLVVALFFFWTPYLIQSISVRITEKVGLSNIQSIIYNDKVPTSLIVFSELKGSHLLIGYPRSLNDGVGGDFGLMSFLKYNGLFGVSLIFLLILSRINKFNGLPLFIIVGTSLHYSSMFYLPGQMILGLLLSIDKNSLSSKEQVRE